MKIINLFLISLSNAFTFPLHRENDSIRECFAQLSERSFNNGGPILYIVDEYSEEKIAFTPVPRLIFNFHENINWYHYYYLNHIVIAENLDVAVQKVEAYKNTSLYNAKFTPKGRFLIFTDSLDGLEETFKYLWSVYLINVLIVHRSDIFTSYPFWKQNKCTQSVTVKKIGTCQHFQLRFEQYPRYLRNCTLKAAILGKHIKLPFVDDDTVFDEHPGILIEPLRLLTTKYGLNVDYVIQNEHAQDTYPVEGTRFFSKQMYEGEMDLIVPEPFRLSPTYTVYESSNIVFFETKSWITRKPRKLSNVTVIVSLFTYPVWVTVLLVMLGMMLVTKMMMTRQESELIVVWLLVYGVTLGISISKIPKLGFFRFVLVFYFIYAFHVIYFFQGKLSSVLTSPNYEPAITNLEELADSNLTIIFLYDINRKLLHDSSHPAAGRLFNKSILRRGVFNPAELVLGNSSVAISAFSHDIDITKAYRQQVCFSFVLISIR